MKRRGKARPDQKVFFKKVHPHPCTPGRDIFDTQVLLCKACSEPTRLQSAYHAAGSRRSSLFFFFSFSLPSVSFCTTVLQSRLSRDASLCSRCLMNGQTSHAVSLHRGERRKETSVEFKRSEIKSQKSRSKCARGRLPTRWLRLTSGLPCLCGDLLSSLQGSR